jgi:hypothetical protein
MRYVGERIRIFIGTEPKTEIARKVLECSIQRRTDMTVEFTPMLGPAWEYPTDGFTQGTGFSLRRWMVPAACNWQGRAIYLDADQLVLSDIWDLWTKPEQVPGPRGTSAWLTYQPDKFSAAPWPQSSVMVIDCEAARGQWGWDIARVLDHLRRHPSKQAYADFMHCTWMEPPPQRIEDAWNHLNVYQPGQTKLLHYTKEPEQPWYRPDHPYAREWQLELSVAIATGYVTDDMLRQALAKWNVREDWRTTNGLHPDYARFLSKGGKKKGA